jgi:hypothetical protein
MLRAVLVVRWVGSVKIVSHAHEHTRCPPLPFPTHADRLELPDNHRSALVVRRALHNHHYRTGLGGGRQAQPHDAPHVMYQIVPSQNSPPKSRTFHAARRTTHHARCSASWALRGVGCRSSLGSRRGEEGGSFLGAALAGSGCLCSIAAEFAAAYGLGHLGLVLLYDRHPESWVSLCGDLRVGRLRGVQGGLRDEVGHASNGAGRRPRGADLTFPEGAFRWASCVAARNKKERRGKFGSARRVRRIARAG